MTTRRAWAIWGILTLVTLPVSLILWWAGGTAMCGEEVYNTPPGALDDSLCDALVEPVAPSAAIAALPTPLAPADGFAGLRLDRRRLFFFSLIAPFVLGVGSVLVFLAVF